MEQIIVIQIINLALAIAAILPSSFILKKLIKERKLVAAEDRQLNNALTAVFIGVVIFAVTNAVLSLLAILDVGHFANYLSPLGRLITNAFFSIASWLIYIVEREIERN